jgi:glycosyltransferase involved in cell wall biosynthesis
LPARGCHALFAISESVLASLPPNLQSRTTVITNATPEPDRYINIEEHSGPLRFVIASRWNGWKGHRTLLAAWDQLDQPGELVVLGGAPASGESVDVRELAAGLRFPDSVRVVGEVPDPAPYLEAADVILMPSDQPEPFGLVAIEAFARGRPVIASAGGGLLDIVIPGENGWLFPSQDVAALKAVLAGLTRTDVTEAGIKARQSYLDRYTTKRYAAEWNQAIKAD